MTSVQLLSRVWLFATPWIAAHQASLSITTSRSSLRLTSIESVMPSSHLILCHPLLLLPPIPPSIRVFSNESTLRMRWPKYWSWNDISRYKFNYQMNCSQLSMKKKKSVDLRKKWKILSGLNWAYNLGAANQKALRPVLPFRSQSTVISVFWNRGLPIQWCIIEFTQGRSASTKCWVILTPYKIKKECIF